MKITKDIYKTAVKYALFAGIAIAVNLGTQFVLLQVYSGKYSIYLAILGGTGTGLIVKYVLDKKYIFYYSTKNVKHDFYKFVMYAFMGIVTTAVFWGTELLFHFLFKFKSAKYIGGFLGLFIGYTTKYFLDKKFVFIDKKAEE